MWAPQVGIFSRPSRLIICCPLISIFLKHFDLRESWWIFVAELAQIELNFLRNISTRVNLSLPPQYYRLFQRHLSALYKLEDKLFHILVISWPQWNFIFKRVREIAKRVHCRLHTCLSTFRSSVCPHRTDFIRRIFRIFHISY